MKHAHPNFTGLRRGINEPVMCEACGNDDPETMLVETKEVAKPDHVRKIKGSAEWVGYKCACCQHVTRFDGM